METKARTGGSFAASEAQREKVRHLACLVCWQGPCDPAHLIPRSLKADVDGEPLRVVPLCREHHRAYDAGELDLLPYLGKGWRHELARAVVDHPGGLVGALERLTNRKWAPQ